MAAPPPASVVGSRHVYVHFPFCASKCPYCDFNSHAGQDALIDEYVSALLREAQTRGPGPSAVTVFVGGGTPTHCDADTLERYLSGVREAVAGADLVEFTVEANPGTLDRAKVRALRNAGVGRVSLGAQSFDDEVLRRLGRAHDASDAVRSVEVLREGGIEHLSVDLILSVPGQSRARQERDLARVIDLEPEHVSAYVLTFEPGTPFAAWAAEGRMRGPDDERDLAHLHLAVETLEAAGFERYEVSNFAQPGAPCRHNLAYWRDDDWCGLGAGAHSHVGARRWMNVANPAAYAAAMTTEGEAVAWIEEAPPEVQLFDALMMGVRLVRGVERNDVHRKTGLEPVAHHRTVLDRLRGLGLCEWDPTRLWLTSRGFDVASAVLRELLPEASVERTDVRTVG